MSEECNLILQEAGRLHSFFSWSRWIGGARLPLPGKETGRLTDFSPLQPPTTLQLETGHRGTEAVPRGVRAASERSSWRPLFGKSRASTAFRTCYPQNLPHGGTGGFPWPLRWRQDGLGRVVRGPFHASPTVSRDTRPFSLPSEGPTVGRSGGVARPSALARADVSRLATQRLQSGSGSVPGCPMRAGQPATAQPRRS